jgi:hypothetical protein
VLVLKTLEHEFFVFDSVKARIILPLDEDISYSGLCLISALAELVQVSSKAKAKKKVRNPSESVARSSL